MADSRSHNPHLTGKATELELEAEERAEEDERRREAEEAAQREAAAREAQARYCRVDAASRPPRR